MDETPTYRYYRNFTERIKKYTVPNNHGNYNYRYRHEFLINGEWAVDTAFFTFEDDYYNKELLTEAEYLARSSKLGRLLYG